MSIQSRKVYYSEEDEEEVIENEEDDDDVSWLPVAASSSLNTSISNIRLNKRSLVEVTPETPPNEAEFDDELNCVIRKNLGLSIGSVWNPRLHTMYAVPWKKGIPDPHDTTPSNEDQIFMLGPDERAIFHRFAHTVLFKTATQPGTTRFNGFRLNETNGFCEYLALMFGLKAFTNPAFGTNACGEEVGHVFSLERNGHRIIRSKVLVYIEPLVRVFYENDPIQTFMTQNVVGFRMWYLVQDPEFDPIFAVDTTISELKYMSGEVNNIKRFTADESPFAEQLAEVEVGSPAFKAIISQMEKANRQINDIMTEARKSLIEYEREFRLGSKRPEHLLMTIKSRHSYYNLIQYYLKKCHRCAMLISGLCETCQNMGDNILNYECPRYTDVNGQPMSMDEVIDNIRFSPLMPSHEAAVVMERMDWRRAPTESQLGDHEWLMHITLNPALGYSGVIEKKTADLMMRAGVCAEQCANDNYFSACKMTGRNKFTFFHEQLLFDLFPKALDRFDNFFTEREFPWVFSVSDLMLAVAKQRVQGSAAARQAEHVKRHCRNITETRGFDDAVAWSAAYDDHFIDEEHSEYFQSEPLTASSFPGISCPVNEEFKDPSLVIEKVDNDDDRYFKQMERRLKDLQAIKDLLPEAIYRRILQVIQQEGVVAFGTMFQSTNNKITQLQRAAAAMIEEACNPRTRFNFYEIQTADLNIGVDGSYILSIMLYFGCLDRDIMDNHIAGLQMLHAVYRASHSARLEILIKAVDTMINIVNQGTASTGKSVLIRILEQLLVDHTIQYVSSQSLRANAIAAKMQGKALVADELNYTNDAFLAGLKGDVSAVTQMKEAITRHETVHKVLHLDDDGTRVQKEIIMLWHCANFLTANNWRTTKGEKSWYDRFDAFFSLAHQVLLSFGANGSKGNVFSVVPASIQDVSPTGISKRVAWYKLAHALHIQASLAEHLGALPYPNMALFGVLYSMAEQHMSKRFPSFADSARRAGRIYAHVKTKVIARAIQMVFTSPEISPLIKFKPDGSMEKRHMQKNSILMIAPYLQATRSLCIFEISLAVHQHILPTKHWLTIARIAKTFCRYGTSNPSYATRVNDSQVEIEDRNYLQTTVTYEAIYATAVKWGYNEATLMEMLTYMEDMQIVTDYIDPTDATGRTVARNKKINVIEVIGRGLTPNRAANPMMSVSTPQTIDNHAKLRIAIKYLTECSPKEVSAFLMEAFEDEHTREGPVLVGDTLPGYPQFLAVHNLRRRPGKITTVSNTSFRNPFVANHIVPDTGISYEMHELNKNAEQANRDIVINGDIEELVLMDWLRKNQHFLPVEHQNEAGMRNYLPANYDAIVKERRQHWPIFNKSRVSATNYPYECINDINYTELLHINHPIFSHYAQNAPQQTDPTVPTDTVSTADPLYDLDIEQFLANASSSTSTATTAVPQSKAHLFTKTPAKINR